MTRRVSRIRFPVLMVTALLGLSTPAACALIDFESLSDLDPVTTQFPGLTFSNTTVATAGIDRFVAAFHSLDPIN